MTRRLCCKRRRTAGAPDFTDTAPVDRRELDRLDQLAADGDPAMHAILNSIVMQPIASHPRPVGQSRYRRVRCWLETGHLFLPGETGCFDCGYAPRRGWPYRRR